MPLGFNLLQGPTCACFIQTAVQQQRLYSLNRIRRAQRLIEQLKPILLTLQQPSPAPSEPPGQVAASASPPVDTPSPPQDQA